MRTTSPAILVLYLLSSCVTLCQPLSAAVIYDLSGLLQWNSSTAPDRLGLNGLAFSIRIEITDSTPDAVADPNGTQVRYDTSAVLTLGSTVVPGVGAPASFFISGNGNNDVANFYFNPSSGNPAFYYPAIQLQDGSNTAAVVRPPLYGPGAMLSVFLLVPGLNPGDPAENTLYQILSPSLTVTETTESIPEPSTLFLAGLGILCIAGRYGLGANRQ